MKYVGYIVGAAALGVALAGCGNPYYPSYGRSQSYYSPSGYSYSTPGYGYSTPGYSYSPAGYGYGAPAPYSYNSRSEYYRNYNGIHSPPERTYP